ncbi:MAG: LysR family transcriptional regulator [Caulobacterales bacterium]|nr:LysR family transcriptional regulator [Caulobacterales bacterium]
MKPLPNLRHLRYLVALHDHGHFGHAAQACFVTQSTLSAGIRELESAFGVEVAERNRRSVTITPVGRRIVASARLLLREAEALMAMGLEHSRPMSGTIEMGVLPTIGPYLLPRLIRGVGAAFPHLRLRLREDKTGQLLGWLAEGRLELAMIAFPYDTPGLETYMLFDDAYRFVTSAASVRAQPPKQRGRAITESDFESQDMLLLEHDHCLHSHALPVLRHAAEAPGASYASTSLHTLVAMVAEGMGATLLPDLAITGGILDGSDVVVRPLAEDAGARTVGLCWRKGCARADTFRRLGEFISGWALDHVRPWRPDAGGRA